MIFRTKYTVERSENEVHDDPSLCMVKNAPTIEQVIQSFLGDPVQNYNLSTQHDGQYPYPDDEDVPESGYYDPTKVKGYEMSDYHQDKMAAEAELNDKVNKVVQPYLKEQAEKAATEKAEAEKIMAAGKAALAAQTKSE